MMFEPKLYMNGHYIVPGTVFNIESYEKMDKNFEIACPNTAKFTGNIYGRSSIRFPHFILIRQKTWMPWAILVSDWQGGKSLKLGGTMNCYFVGMMYMGDPVQMSIFRADHT